MTMTFTDVKRVFQRYQDLLEGHRELLNALNVYPVPDGDTGSNMLTTVRRVNEQLVTADSMDAVGRAIADGSLRGASGNSGLILSLILRGMAEPLADSDVLGIDEFASGLSLGTAHAYAQVGNPLEGTILTVVREAAEEAASRDGAGWTEFLEAVYRRAVDALARTPQLLPVLARAGVVDAGGAGVVLLLAAFVCDQNGVDVSLPADVLAMRADLEAVATEAPPVGDLRYEVMFFLDAADDSISGLRATWAQLGDSIVVVGGEGEWNCHIHTDHVGPAIEAGIAIGRPREIQVTDLMTQRSERHGTSMASVFQPEPEAAVAPVGVVAVVAGEGLVDLFRSLWVQGVVVGGQSMNPSADDLLRVVDSVPARKVVVLPNNKNVVPVAEQLDSLTTKQVVVVPTRSVPQGVAAMMGYATGEESLEDAAQTMSAAASSIISAEVTRAVRRARVDDVGEISQGDWMGVVDGTPIVASPDLWTAISTLVRRIMTTPIELVTLYAGSGADPGVTAALATWIGEEYPGCDVQVVDGGQPLYPYLLSFE